ncbi:MAG: hypothetical protein KKB37_14130 [Alphaproteobacteria bacterium]|nr:hypothetical protein [Alphaproteobacteria bacterium]
MTFQIRSATIFRLQLVTAAVAATLITGTVAAQPVVVQGKGSCPPAETAECTSGYQQDAVAGSATDHARRLRDTAVREALRLNAIIEKREIPKLRIGWSLNKPFDAYMKALDAGKPLVIFFHAGNCNFCNRLLDKFSCPQINRFAGRAVFAVTLPHMDERGRQFSHAAAIRSYPTVVVFRPDRERIHIVGQAVGELSIRELDRHLEKAIAEAYAATGRTEPESSARMLSVDETRSAYKKLGIDDNSGQHCEP